MGKKILVVILVVVAFCFAAEAFAAAESASPAIEDDTAVTIKSTSANTQESSTTATTAGVDSSGSIAKATLMATTTTSGGQAFKSSESFQVEPTTGTASLSVPIEVPPGRKGIQPNIVLAYSSASPNGITGVGWNLDLGSIQRSAKKGVPTYDDAKDSFVLVQQGSAQELVSLGDNQYRPKIEGAFMKIEYLNNSWTITDKKSIKYYFGQTAASQQNDGTRIFKWCLDRVEDLNGNYMTIAYLKDQNQIYPEHIYYTGNSATGANTFADIEFIYETRTDTNTSYRTNFSITTARRLKEIFIKVETNLQRKYQFGYNYSTSTDRSLLTSVIQYGSDGLSSLPATTFTYQSGDKGFASVSDWNIPTGSEFVEFSNGRYADLGIRIVDVNSDGFPDLVRNYHDCSEIPTRNTYLHNKSKDWNVSSDWVIPNDLPGFIRRCPEIDRDRGIRLVDANSDGWVDVVRHYKRDPYWGGQFYNQAYINNQSNSFNHNSSWDMPYDTAFTHERGVPVYDYSEFMGTELVDVNADGFNDVVRSKRGDFVSHWTFLSNASNGGTGWTRNTSWDPPVSEYTDLASGAAFVDLNGDGMPDIMHKKGGTTKIYMNTGASWTEDSGSAWLNTFGYGDLSDGTTQFADINGDGLSDMIIAKGSYANGSRVLLNTGKAWKQDDEWVMPEGEFKNLGTRILDANADGLIDFIINISGQTKKLYLNKGKAVDLLSTIDNGLGSKTLVSYLPSTKFQNTFLPFPVQTVSRVTITDQVSNQSYYSDYEYKNGLFDFKDREFRGFGWVKTVDSKGNYTETTILQDDIYKGRIKESRTYDSMGNLYAKAVNEWQEEDLGNGSKFVYLAKTDNFTYEGDATGKRTQAQYFYEESPQEGNLTKTIELGEVALDTGNDIGSDKRTTIIEYVNNSANWLLGLPKRTYVQDNSGITVKKAEFYYDDNASLDDLPVKGNLTKQIDWLDGATSPATTFTYDAYGNLLNSTDALGRSNSVTYDSTYKMFPLITTNALGYQAVTQYYGVDGVALDDEAGYHGLWGQVKSVKDPNNKSASTTYDTFGRSVATVSEYDSINYPTSSVEYDLSSTPIKITTHQREVSGQVGTLDSWQFYDGLGRLVETKTESADAAQQIISGLTEYNSRGLPIKKYLPVFTPATPNFTTPNYSGPFTKIDYDSLGRVIKTTNPDGSYAEVIYDDWKVETIDENGHKLASYSDAYGRLIKKEEYSGADGRSPHYTTTPYALYATTLYAYDTLGNLIQTQDNANHVTTIAYDTLGRKKSMADPDMGNWQYFYDALGNLVKQIDNKNQKTEFQYDALNRLAIKSYPLSGQPNVTYTYDDIAVANSKGRLTQASYQSNSNTRFSYDSLGRETQSTKKIDGVDYTISRSYDAASRLVTINYPDTSQISYTYNSAGQIESVYAGINNYVTSVDYSVSGQITKIVYGNGVATDYAYDPNTLRLTHLVTKDSKNNTLQDLGYSFDEVGNVLAITDNLNSASQTFAYDALNRLIGASGTYYGNKTYAYDAIGNITSKDGLTFNYGEGAAGPHALTSISDGTIFTYDLNGNMLTQTKNSIATNYSYDWENRLAKVVKANKDLASFAYDGDGGRTKKTAYSYKTTTRYNCPPKGSLPPKPVAMAPAFDKTNKRYVFEFLSSFLEEKAEAAEGSMQLTMLQGCVPYTTTVAISTPTVYVGNLLEKTNNVITKHIFLGSQRIASITGTSVNYYHPNHLGSSDTITNELGVVVQRIEYDPYGTIVLAEGANKTDYKFTGKELDEETGLYFFGARYYNPIIGRWMTPDPTVQHPDDPQDFNRYTYCRGNPINLTDPSGLSWKSFWKRWGSAMGSLFGFFGSAAKGIFTGDWSTFRNQAISGIMAFVFSGGNPFAFIAATIVTPLLETPPGQQAVNWAAHQIFDDAFGMRPRAAYFWSYLVTDALLTAGVSYSLESIANPTNAKVVKPDKLTSEQSAEYNAILSDPKAMKSTNVTGREMLGDKGRIMSEKTYRALVVDDHVKGIVANDWIRLFGVPIPLQHTAVAIPGGGDFSTNWTYLWSNGVCHQERMLALRSAGVSGITPLTLNKSIDTWLSYGVYGTYGGLGYTIDNVSRAAYYTQERYK